MERLGYWGSTGDSKSPNGRGRATGCIRRNKVCPHSSRFAFAGLFLCGGPEATIVTVADLGFFVFCRLGRTVSLNWWESFSFNCCLLRTLAWFFVDPRGSYTSVSNLLSIDFDFILFHSAFHGFQANQLPREGAHYSKCTGKIYCLIAFIL